VRGSQPVVRVPLGVPTLTHGIRLTHEDVRHYKDCRGEENQPQPPEGQRAPRTAFI
ncbi:hypothetical protein AVEN_163665-1, partial [Araneus ventricosus]